MNFGAPASTTTSTGGALNLTLGTNTTQGGLGGGGFQLSQPAAQTSSAASFGGFNFGSNNTASNPLLGGKPSTAVAPLSSDGLFGATSGASSTASTSGTTGGLGGFSVGQTTGVTSAGGGFSFGGQTSTASAGGFSFAGSTTTATTTTTSSSSTGLGGISFGGQTSTASSTPSLGGISFGGTAASTAPASTAASVPFSFGGLGGAATTASSSGTTLGLGGAPTAGLGGAQPPPTSAGEAAGSSAEGRSCKEIPLPHDIFATIAAFEQMKSTEKAASEANLQQSAAAFHKLGEDCTKLRSLVTQLSTVQAALQQRVNALKEKIVASSEDVEMARRTHTTPAHLQGDNLAPELYFSKVLEKFEQHMLSCKDRIEEVEKCLALTGRLMDSDAAVRELVRRQHEDLQVAAAHVYKLHAQLLQLHAILPCPDHLAPKPLFRVGAGDLAKLDDRTSKSAVPPESAIVRNSFDLSGGTSRLGAYQLNMAKARALSLNPAPPPTQPLVTQQPLFGNLGTQNNFGTTNFSGGSGLAGGTSAFGSSLTGSTFGTSAFGNTGTLGFGNTGTSGFGNTGTSGFGNTGTSAFGNTGTSAFGNTGTSAFGNTGTSAFGNTGTSAFGNTGTSAFGNTGTPAFGNTKTLAFGNAGTSAFGNTGLSTFGNAGTSNFGTSGSSAFGNTSGSTFGNIGSSTFGNTTGSAFGNTSSCQPSGSLFSSPFGQSNKLFNLLAPCSRVTPNTMCLCPCRNVMVTLTSASHDWQRAQLLTMTAAARGGSEEHVNSFCSTSCLSWGLNPSRAKLRRMPRQESERTHQLNNLESRASNQRERTTSGGPRTMKAC
ncbi:hypothetical protein FHG87_004816 [Trinorchestia longiramus]|nr:hypothetical protein FHG87_004816 [Trinorchestia longiramus]